MATLMYNRQKQRIYNQNVPIHIFGTSSSGNSVYLTLVNLLIDLGLPYKRYHDYDPNFFSQVKYVILTHEHGDHLNPATLKKLLKDWPNIKFFITYRFMTMLLHEPRLTKKLDPKILYNYRHRFIIINEVDTGRFAYGYNLTSFHGTHYNFTPYLTEHGELTNIAIDIRITENQHHVLYASDLDTFNAKNTTIPNKYYNPSIPQQTPIMFKTQGLPAVAGKDLYDVIFLEANYDANIVNDVIQHNQEAYAYRMRQESPLMTMNDPEIKKIRNIITKAQGNLRHISEQQAWYYVERHLKDNGVFVPLHASSTYGTLIQKTDNNNW